MSKGNSSSDMDATAPKPWHQGTCNPHVIYAADQTIVVVCRSAQQALEIVIAINNMDIFTCAAKKYYAEIAKEQKCQRNQPS